MKKKLLCLFLTLVMVLGLIPTAALATSEGPWDALQTALNGTDPKAEEFSVSKSDDVVTVTLKKDVALRASDVDALTVAKDSEVVLDLGGYTLQAALTDGSAAYLPAIQVLGELTVQNGTAVGAFKVSGEDARLTVAKNGVVSYRAESGELSAIAADSKSHVEIYGVVNNDTAADAGKFGAVISAETEAEVTTYDGAAVISVTGDTAIENYAGLVTVRGGNITGPVGIYSKGSLSNYAVQVLSGTVSGTEKAIVIDGSKFEILDGTVKGIGSGTALYIDNTGAKSSVNIGGGTLESESGYAVDANVYNAELSTLKTYITGGRFKGVSMDTEGYIRTGGKDGFEYLTDLDTYGLVDKKDGYIYVLPRAEKPAAGKGYEINYEDGMVHAASGYEVSLSGDDKDFHDTVTFTQGTPFYVRARAMDNLVVSQLDRAASLSVKVETDFRCVVLEARTTLAEGVSHLYVGGRDMGLYNFEYVAGKGWAIANYDPKNPDADKTYLYTANGTTITSGTTPTYWKYNNGGFCVTIEDSGVISSTSFINRIFDRLISLLLGNVFSSGKGGTYYMVNTATGQKNTVVSAQQMHMVGYLEHDFVYTYIGNDKHLCECSHCQAHKGNSETDDCSYNSYHVCECGHMKDEFLPVVTTSSQRVRSGFLFWKTVYTVKMDTHMLAATHVEVSIDGGLSWSDYTATGTFSSKINPTSFLMRVSAADGVYTFDCSHDTTVFKSFTPAA